MGYYANKNAPEGDYYLLTSFNKVNGYTDWNLGTAGSDPFLSKTVAVPQVYGYL